MNKFLKQAHDYAKSKNGECLSNEYINAKKPLIFKCHKESHNSWSSLIYELIQRNTWCPQCRDEKSKNSHNEKFLKKAQEYAKKQNGILISTEFISAKTKMEWKCHQEHHKSFFSTLDHCVNRNRWCPDCSINRPTWSTNKEIALQTAKENSGLVIFPKDIELIKTNTMLTWKCSNHEHKPWKSLFRNVCELKTWCPECAGKFTKEEFVEKAHKYAKSKGGICLTNSYQDQYSLFTFKCSVLEHKKFNSEYRRIFSTWCKECKKKSEPVIAYQQKKLQEAKEHAKSRGGECLSTQFTTKDEYLIWKCHEGHNWKATFYNIVGSLQRWCPECAGQLSPENLLKKAENYAKKNNGQVLTKYISLAKDKVEWKCADVTHQSWKVSLSSITNQKNWCPQCGYENYYMENNFRIILEEMLGFSLKKSRPSWNINPKTKHFLEFDGYNEEHNVAFEFQGAYHFKKIFKNQDLENTQFKDNQKLINCKKNGTILIVIEENSKMSDIKFCIDFLENYLPTIGLSFKKITNIDNLYHKLAELTRTKEKNKKWKIACDKANERNGKCLSIAYVNSKDRMKWKCSNELHQPWLATYDTVVLRGKVAENKIIRKIYSLTYELDI